MESYEADEQTSRRAGEQRSRRSCTYLKGASERGRPHVALSPQQRQGESVQKMPVRDTEAPKPKLHVSTIHSSEERIKVFVRVRPLVERERLEHGGNSEVATTTNPGLNQVEVRARGGTSKCCFDGVFPPETTQEEVFAQVRDCVLSVTEGFNATCFAYGQTGSGKTFTMFGDDRQGDMYSYSASSTTPPSAGIIPRAVRDILGYVRSSNETCTCYVSFMQIYNEQVFDLLRDPSRSVSLAVKEDSRMGIFVEGLSEFAVESEHDCLRLLRAGDERRAVRSTRMNDLSSRSHSVFQMVLEQRRDKGKAGTGQKFSDASGAGHVVRSKLNLVDLAGSEKWDVHANIGDAHISELTNINLSLHTLSRCIEALAKPSGERAYVPYRESKLTRLLQDSLGGSAKTRLFAMLSPSISCAQEAQATIRFADCAKRVMQHVKIKETRAIDHVLVARLEKEVQELRAKLRMQASASAASLQSSASAAQLGGHSTNATISSEGLVNGPASSNAVARSESEKPEVTVRTIVSSEVLEELALYRKRCSSLESIIDSIDKCANSFFRFEIEEEELETEMLDHLRRAKAIRKKRIESCIPSGLPINSNDSFSKTAAYKNATGKAMAMPREDPQSAQIPRLKGPLGRKSMTKGMKFRIRSSGTPAGSGANLVESRRSGGCSNSPWMTDEQKQDLLEARLKEANRKMKKQKKLQAWLAEKSRKEKEALDEQLELEQARKKAVKEAESRRRERNRANKEKLAEWRHTQIEELNALLGGDPSSVPDLPDV